MMIRDKRRAHSFTLILKPETSPSNLKEAPYNIIHTRSSFTAENTTTQSPITTSIHADLAFRAPRAAAASSPFSTFAIFIATPSLSRTMAAIFSFSRLACSASSFFCAAAASLACRMSAHSLATLSLSFWLICRVDAGVSCTLVLFYYHAHEKIASKELHNIRLNQTQRLMIFAGKV